MAEPADKHPEIRRFQSDLMGTDVEQTIRRDTCVSCKGPATKFNDECSRREFSISGLCQQCQDRVIGSLEAEEE
jgi:hypothetical protein